jgi:riboflavin kinase/FMN adenylyltransferase
MEIISGLENVRKKYKDPVLALGVFDGIHLGHQKILRKVKEGAVRIGGTSLLLTFEPHPRKVLDSGNAPPLLTTREEKIRLIEKMGLDLLILIRFDRKFSQVSPREFAEEILDKKLKAKEVFVGPDYVFGKERLGTVKLLKELGQKYGFGVNIVRAVKVNNVVVRSTEIRNLLRQGRIEKASFFLGRNPSFGGRIVPGREKGRLLGYPTANVKPYSEMIPLRGVYAVKVILEGQKYKGIMNIGRRPTFSQGSETTLEVHLFDFKENIYGKEIEVILLKRIRDEIHFKSIEELERQIRKDESVAKKYFTNR